MRAFLLLCLFVLFVSVCATSFFAGAQWRIGHYDELRMSQYDYCTRRSLGDIHAVIDFSRFVLTNTTWADMATNRENPELEIVIIGTRGDRKSFSIPEFLYRLGFEDDAAKAWSDSINMQRKDSGD